MFYKNDFKLNITDGVFDIAIDNGDIANEPGMQTSLYVLLFTDARADESQVGAPEQRSGWLGNLVSNVQDRQLGGLLYLTEQKRMTQSTLNETVDFARKSLYPLVQDGIAKSIDVSGEVFPRYGIKLKIIINTSIDSTTFYFPLWEFTVNGI